MNEPERKILYLALALFALGLLYRYLPWSVPAISRQDIYSELEYVAEGDGGSKSSSPLLVGITNKVTKRGEGKKKDKKGKKSEKKRKTPNLPVRVNHAGVEEMCALKGVGPKLAEKIVEFRSRNGPFSGPGDLEKVPGIGKKKMEGLLKGVIFD